MVISKMNIGLAISKNYDKVSLDLLDEPIEHNNVEELRANIRERFKVLREEVQKEFENIQ